MDIQRVSTSSTPWYIGRHQGGTFFGHTRIEVVGRCMDWMRHKCHSGWRWPGEIDIDPPHIHVDFAAGDDETRTMIYDPGERKADD